jgi:hypothetical protein
VVSEGLGDVGGAVDAQDAQGEVSERGHGAGSGVGADFGAVFVVGDIAYPMQAVFYGPVAADPGGEVGCGGLLSGQTGDRIHDFGGPFLAVQPSGFAGDLDGLAGVGEDDSGRYGDEFDAALFHPAVGAGGGGVCGRDIFSGQGLELVKQVGLVAPSGDQLA